MWHVFIFSILCITCYAKYISRNKGPQSVGFFVIGGSVFTHKWHLMRHSQFHYNDVIMSVMASHLTSLTIVYSTVYSRRRSKKTSKLRVSGFCEGNSPHKGPVMRKMFHLVTSSCHCDIGKGTGSTKQYDKTFDVIVHFRPTYFTHGWPRRYVSEDAMDFYGWMLHWATLLQWHMSIIMTGNSRFCSTACSENDKENT